MIRQSLSIFHERFVQDENVEGYRKDGPASVTKFELGAHDEPNLREQRALRQCGASDVIEQLLERIGNFQPDMP